MSNLFVFRAARFSEDRTYRWRLDVEWGSGPRVNFLMLNPSTADEVVNDPTVERCQRRAEQWGYGGLVVTNLFAYRSTNPLKLLEAQDPIGAENDRAIMETARDAGMVVCAWAAQVTGD